MRDLWVKGCRHGNNGNKMATTITPHRRRSCIATQRSDRGYSSKVQQMVKRLEREAGEVREEEGRRGEKYEPRNWRERSQKELERLGPVARSRYMAYEPPSKEVQEKQTESVRRVRERVSQQKMAQQEWLSLGQSVELEKDSELIGQIKAAEAQHRVKSLRQCFEKQQEEEVQWLVSSQPTSLEAVRLKAFMKPHPLDHAHLTTPSNSLLDPLSHTQRKRCEILIEDNKR